MVRQIQAHQQTAHMPGSALPLWCQYAKYPVLVWSNHCFQNGDIQELTVIKDVLFELYLSIREIIHWASNSNRGLGPYESESMEDKVFSDLSIRLGHPYLYKHQGDCEHLIVFTDVRSVCFLESGASVLSSHLLQLGLSIMSRYIRYIDTLVTIQFKWRYIRLKVSIYTMCIKEYILGHKITEINVSKKFCYIFADLLPTLANY